MFEINFVFSFLKKLSREKKLFRILKKMGGWKKFEDNLCLSFCFRWFGEETCVLMWSGDHS